MLIVAALALAAGCGLSDYEAQMAAEQKRLDALDEEAKILGEAVDLPLKTEPGAAGPPKQQSGVFLRLPKGISAKGEAFGELLQRFTRPFNSPYGRRYSSGETETQTLPFQELYVGAAASGTAEEFAQKILAAFGTTLANPLKKVVDPPGRSRMEFTETRFEDTNNPPSTFLAYFVTRNNVHVAVIFRVPKDQAQSAGITKGVDVTLQSLAVGPEADEQRQRYASAKPK